MSTMGKRAFPKGESPFCSPKPGVVVEAESGRIRRVTNVVRENDRIVLIYYIGDEGCQMCCNRATWIDWCSKNKAKLIHIFKDGK